MSKYRPYLQALKNAGPAGFTPIGWLYSGIMEDMCREGLATWAKGGYVISELGARELARSEEEGRLGMYELRDRAESICGSLQGIVQRLGYVGFGSGGLSKYDEDYKVRKWYKNFTNENFDRLDALVKALSEEFERTVGKDLE